MNNIQEKRSESRINQQSTIFVEVCVVDSDKDEGPQVIVCNSIDFSANGIQIQMDRAVAVGTILRLCVDIDNGEKEIYLVGEAKWIKPSSEDLFNIGFELYDAEGTDIINWKETIANMLS